MTNSKQKRTNHQKSRKVATAGSRECGVPHVARHVGNAYSTIYVILWYVFSPSDDAEESTENIPNISLTKNWKQYTRWAVHSR